MRGLDSDDLATHQQTSETATRESERERRARIRRHGGKRAKPPLTPDLCVIGAGSGGLSVAAAAAMFGVSVVLVERDRMGGDCLNVGCVPSKALIAAGPRAQAMREAGPFGITAGEPQVNFAQRPRPCAARHRRDRAQ